MKLRVLGFLSVLSLLIVAGASALILGASAREATREVQITRLSALDRFAQLAADADASGDTRSLTTEMEAYAELYGEAVVAKIGANTITAGDPVVAPEDLTVALAQAMLNVNTTSLDTLWPFDASTQLLARSFGSANQVGGAIALEVDTSAATAALRGQWLLVLAIALAVEAALLAGALVVTRWILRPVSHLTQAVAELTHEASPHPIPELGPPELRELSRSFSRMASVITGTLGQQRHLISETSHQLRNSVAALRLRTDLLEQELHDGDTSLTRDVQTELDRLEDTLEGMLRLALAEHRVSEREVRGSAAAESRSHPLAVVQEELESLAPRAALAGTHVVLRADASIAEIACSRVDLTQVVGEVLSNALKYGGPGEIAVEISQGEQTVTIAVTDEGPGLSEEELHSVTRRFWRSAQHRNVEGTGLGLAFVDRIMVANGGTLNLEPASAGGLRVLLTFVVADLAHPDESMQEVRA